MKSKTVSNIISNFPSYSKVALATTANIVLNAATLGHYVWLEGRVHKGVFENWAERFRYTPRISSSLLPKRKSSNSY